MMVIWLLIPMIWLIIMFNITIVIIVTIVVDYYIYILVVRIPSIIIDIS